MYMYIYICVYMYLCVCVYICIGLTLPCGISPGVGVAAEWGRSFLRPGQGLTTPVTRSHEIHNTRTPRGYPPAYLRPLFGHLLRTTCTSRPTRYGSPPFCMFCVLCRDSLRGQSSVNLECCFVSVWPQTQTFVKTYY